MAGFTLIEMAIVLIIIGIIIGAVVKGKDLVRSAEQKRLYTTWLREWQLAYNNYYDRTGRILGDTNTAQNTGTRDGHCSNPSEANLQSQLEAVGLKAPAKGPSGHIAQRTYTDSSGHMYTMYINFYYTAQTGNYIAVRNIPYDLGMAWDRIIDGEMNGASGSFLYGSTWTNPGSGAVWPPATSTTSTSEAGIFKLEF